MTLSSVKGATTRGGLVVLVPLLLFDDDLAFLIVALEFFVRAIVEGALETKLGVSVAEFDRVALGGASSSLCAGATWNGELSLSGDGDGERASGGAGGCAFIVFNECWDV